MLSESAALMYLGALLIVTAAYLILARMLETFRRRNSVVEHRTHSPARTQSIPRAMLLVLLPGVTTIAIGVSLAPSVWSIESLPFTVACVASGLIVSLPGVSMMLRGWASLAIWIRERPTMNPPARWLVGAVLTITTFTLVAVLVPAVYINWQ